VPESLSQQIRRFLRDPLVDARRLQRGGFDTDHSRDVETTVVMLSVAIALTIQQYGIVDRIARSTLVGIAELYWPHSATNLPAEFVRLASWTAGQLFGYVVIPLLVLTILVRRPLSEYGVKFRGATRYWWLYAGMYLLILPIVLLASRDDRFLHTYPFYRHGSDEPWWPWLPLWEVMYAAQFFALEFFFRGYLLHSTKHRLGPYAILAMSIPYCMIHFGKPLPETLGAIIAGVVLGFMSLNTGSIWMGALLHVAVAWTMDAAAMWQRSL
jgi:membrane protease YdiL (CAAX protease family)